MHGSTCTDRRPAPRLRALVVGVAAAGALAGCTIPTDTDPGETPAAQTPAVETTADEVGPAPGETEDAALAAQSQRFSDEFDAFAAGLPGRAAIAVVVPGPGGEQEVFAAGEPAAPGAWPTIKGPWARAALAAHPGAVGARRARARPGCGRGCAGRGPRLRQPGRRGPVGAFRRARGGRGGGRAADRRSRGARARGAHRPPARRVLDLRADRVAAGRSGPLRRGHRVHGPARSGGADEDRKSTRLNSSH